MLSNAALADKIVDLAKAGSLAPPFSAADVRRHFGSEYAETHIRTVLSNYSDGTGYWVKRGFSARFKRHSRGKYLCA
jgi:hypothetical protein